MTGLLTGLHELEASRVLSNQGKFARALEERIATLVEAPYCSVFASGTTALMCLGRALDLTGEVILPSFTFAATAQALGWQGLRLRFVDIDPHTLHITPEIVDAAITPETRAVLPVNLFGGCARLDEFEALAERRGLRLFFDSAQAFGARFKGRPVGTFGDAEVLSFHATKAFHTGEGGAVVTRNRELHERLCRIRNFGFGNYLDCVELGLNGKMDELSALLGLRLLDEFTELVAARRHVVAEYWQGLHGIPGLSRPDVGPAAVPSPSYFALRIDDRQFGLDAVELNYALMAERIVTRCYFYPPVHRTTYYQRFLGPDAPLLPATDAAATSTLCLPLHADLTPAAMSTIVYAIERVQTHAPAIREALRGKVPRDWDAHSAGKYRDPYDIFISGRAQLPAQETTQRSV
jgi:dTDP-4-amino-4,6-dideoxygalactose transaminase